MDMKKIHSDKLRAIGYDAVRRLLRVELEGGAALEYSGVSADLWRRFTASGVAWSFYRDNIEEEFPAKAGARVAGSAGAQEAALDALFGGGVLQDSTGSVWSVRGRRIRGFTITA